MNVKDKVALVTGSSAGLGKQMALTLGRAGAKVAMNYHNNQARALQTFSEFQEAGCQGTMIQADVTDETGVRELARQVEQELGPIDILVVNATPDQPQKPIEEYDWSFYQSMLDFFIKSPFLLTRAVLPGMRSKRWGRIINIGSEVFQLGIGNFSAYVAAKGGQAGWTRSMSTELAPWGITVNLISPGWVPVERHEKEPQSAKDAYLATVPLRRWGTPQDVAAAVLFYASEEASFITGQNISVNGGKSFF